MDSAAAQHDGGTSTPVNMMENAEEDDRSPLPEATMAARCARLEQQVILLQVEMKLLREKMEKKEVRQNPGPDAKPEDWKDIVVEATAMAIRLDNSSPTNIDAEEGIFRTSAVKRSETINRLQTAVKAAAEFYAEDNEVEIQRSVWSVAPFIGNWLLGTSGSYGILGMLLLNVGVQTSFIFIVIERLVVPSIDETVIVAHQHWRLNSAHSCEG